MPEPALRDALARLRPTPAGANAGLWLDRFLPEQLTSDDRLRDGQHPHANQFKAAAQLGEPTAIYQRFFDRYYAALDDLRQAYAATPPDPDGFTLRTGTAQARGRLVVGLGAEGVLENTITLNRAYGVPYLPGSALKGLAAVYAHRRLAGDAWRKATYDERSRPVTALGDAHRVVFGDTTTAGYITFFDALYVPGSGVGGRPLHADVLTVHHPEYYNEGGKSAPADWDSPTPVAFISATGRFCVALAGPRLWVDLTWDILALALDELGIGGKTAAGYGRMTLDGLDAAQARLRGESAPSATGEISATNPTAKPAAAEVPKLFADQVRKSNAGALPNLIGQWRALPEAVRPAAARLVIEHARTIRVKELEAKAWYRELQESIQIESS